MRISHPFRAVLVAATVVALAVACVACGSTVDSARRSAVGSELLGGPSAGADPIAAPGTAVAATSSTVGSRIATGRTTIGAVSAAKARASGRVEVGVLLPKVSGAIAAFGLADNAFGDPRAATDAVVADLNRRGGLGGRTVVPVYAYVDVVGTQSYDAQEQAACATFVDDHHAAMVVAPLSNVSVLDDCLLRRHVPLVIGTNFFTDQPEMVVPTSLRLDRAAASLVSQLVAMRFFTPGAVVGVLTSDEPNIAGLGKRSLDAALSGAGVKVAAREVVRYPAEPAQLSQFISDEQGAVLRFRTAGVTHVISFIGATPGYFMTLADSQGFQPAYALTTMDVLYNLPQVAPARQLRRAVGVGWTLATDLASVPAQRELNVAGRRCVAVLQAAGLDMSGGGLAAGLPACDVFGVAKAVLDHEPSAIAAPAFLAGVEALGDSFSAGDTVATRFGPGRRDGVAALRRVAWTEGCTCFTYAGPVQAVTSP